MNFVAEGIMVPAITGFGLIGNIASVVVLRSPKLDMKVSFRHILMMLALFDSMFIVVTTVSFTFEQISTEWQMNYQAIVFPKMLPFIQIALTGSIWSTVSVAVERYLSVVHSGTRFSHLSSKMYVIPVITLSILWNIPRFFELYTCYELPPNLLSEEMFNMTTSEQFNQDTMMNETFPQNISLQIPIVCPSPLRSNPEYIRYYILLANFVMMGALPLFLLILTNLLLYKTISSANIAVSRATMRQKRDQSIAMILVLIVVVFVCCNSVRMVLNMYEVFQAILSSDGGGMEEWPYWCEVLSLISHLLLVLNSSTNILIYCWKDTKFRKELIRTLGGKSVPGSGETIFISMNRIQEPSPV